ncbi:acyltransferase [Agromyces sp. MMS24-K17]|uniref:acyltransferase family protein n=1 Tax=Agromyces sp. MMS24-K17 TaxID=3372850 RepID=UPI00375501D5
MTTIDRIAPRTTAPTRSAHRMPRAASERPATANAARDAGIDAARAACLVVVFALHAMMVGVSVGPDGPVLENAMTGWGGFAAATWLVQVMPLFFVIGGFAGRTAWLRHRERGGTAAGFVRRRLERLVRPAIVLVAVVGAALGLLALAGVPPEIVATAGHRIGQPLWFLAVYLGCSALVPAMSWLHGRLPVAAPALLAAAVVAVDALRGASGVDAIGFLNLAFVWLLMQQLGFLLADGTIDRMPRARRLLVAAGALGVLALAVASGAYSPDLLENLNPPTAALVLLGVTQLMLFSLVRGRLRRWAERPRPARLVDRFGEWGMTLYLWHLPAFVGLAGLLLVAHEVAGLSLPVPLTGDWWATRPVWLVVAAVATGLLVARFARYERGRGGTGSSLGAQSVRGIRSAWGIRWVRGIRVPAWLGALAAIAGVGVALVVGFGPIPALVSVALLAVALAAAAEPSAVEPQAVEPPAVVPPAAGARAAAARA